MKNGRDKYIAIRHLPPLGRSDYQSPLLVQNRKKKQLATPKPVKDLFHENLCVLRKKFALEDWSEVHPV